MGPKKGKGKKEASDSSDDSKSGDEGVDQAGEKMAAAKIKSSPFPVTMVYCEACGCPPEYCGWMGKDGKPDLPKAECKSWALGNVPALAAKLGYVADPEGEAAKPAGEEPKKGGKKEAVKEVLVSSKQRQKRKYVCSIRGLETFGVKLAEACKIFKKKFSTGASVTDTPDNKEEIEIQGDVAADVIGVIIKEFNIPLENIYVVEGSGAKVSKTKASLPLGS